MKLEFLQYFVVLADELHFARAAQKVSITQSALSAAIKSLEADVGVRLFERSRTKVQLTPAGEAFLSEAHLFVEGYSRAKTLTRAVHDGLIGRLEIGFGLTMIYRDVLQVVDQFKQEAPNIELALHEMTMIGQFEGLLRGRLHAGFSAGSAIPSGLQATPLKDDYFALCVPARHPAADAPLVDLRDMAHESFIMVSREVGPSSYDDMMAMFSRAGFTPRLTHTTRNWSSVMTLIAHGCGVGLVPLSMARANKPGVRIVPLSGLPAPVAAVMMWNPTQVSPALAKFIEVAARTIQAQRADLPFKLAP
jgi:DNA-binding transcriptional LysR family regulator